jgi:thiamine-monophosphate kinase
VPLSTSVQRLIESDSKALSTALTGGDDYELVFAVPPGRQDAVLALARHLDLPLTRIGQLVAGTGVAVRGPDGELLETGHAGWQHF